MRNILALLTGLIITTSACTHKKTDIIAIQTVKTDTVRIYGEKNSATFPGKVKAASDVNLAFRISGPITKLTVEAGNFVKKGQVVAEMDSRDYTLQLLATEAEYNRIKAEAERVIALYEKSSVTPNDYDKAVFGLQQITAKYEAHKNTLTDTKLNAPFDGYVQRRFFDVGETVGAGMPVVSMISAELPEVEINIPSSDFVRRDRFETFSCSIDIFPGITFPLELIGIAQKANLNQLYTVRLKIKERAKQLPMPGMTTIVTIYFQTEEETLVYVPLSAVFESEGVSTVWIYNPLAQTVERRAVTLTTILSNGKAVVSQGLNAGEIVVSAGVHALSHGQKVKLLSTASPTNVGGLL
jgi:RND family efflux transporter MFP subunit